MISFHEKTQTKIPGKESMPPDGPIDTYNVNLKMSDCSMTLGPKSASNGRETEMECKVSEQQPQPSLPPLPLGNFLWNGWFKETSKPIEKKKKKKKRM